jgi:hypothetical protein
LQVRLLLGALLIVSALKTVFFQKIFLDGFWRLDFRFLFLRTFHVWPLFNGFRLGFVSFLSHIPSKPARVHSPYLKETCGAAGQVAADG